MIALPWYAYAPLLIAAVVAVFVAGWWIDQFFARREDKEQP